MRAGSGEACLPGDSVLMPLKIYSAQKVKKKRSLKSSWGKNVGHRKTDEKNNYPLTPFRHPEGKEGDQRGHSASAMGGQQLCALPPQEGQTWHPQSLGSRQQKGSGSARKPGPGVGIRLKTVPRNGFSAASTAYSMGGRISAGSSDEEGELPALRGHSLVGIT